MKIDRVLEILKKATADGVVIRVAKPQPWIPVLTKPILTLTLSPFGEVEVQGGGQKWLVVQITTQMLEDVVRAGAGDVNLDSPDLDGE